jgi:5-methylcytosine-specific restriction protein A
MHKLRRRVMRMKFADRMRELKLLQQNGVIHKGRKSWWEADHILPVVEGGDSNLDNIRTLCIACHRAVTKELRERRRRCSIPPAEDTHGTESRDVRI